MYQKFDVVEISAHLSERLILVNMTLDVDTDTVDTRTVSLATADDRQLLSYDLVVDKNNIRIELRDWPTPGRELQLFISDEIRSVSEVALEQPLRRTITFPQTVTNTVQITAPSDHERVDELCVTWLETAGVNSEPTSSFYLEIATEAAFYNVVKATEVFGRTSVTLTDVPEGYQYFVRVRCQSSSIYGIWSQAVSFLYKKDSDAQSDYETPQQDDSPVVEISQSVADPERDEYQSTPTAFVYTFSKNIDPASIVGLRVRRRDV